jgi:hypothetical protein
MPVSNHTDPEGALETSFGDSTLQRPATLGKLLSISEMRATSEGAR